MFVFSSVGVMVIATAITRAAVGAGSDSGSGNSSVAD
jgi:hypothetical protein